MGVCRMLLSIPEIARKFGLKYTTTWNALKNIEPDKKVKHGSRYRSYYDEHRIEEELRKRGYIDENCMQQNAPGSILKTQQDELYQERF